MESEEDDRSSESWSSPQVLTLDDLQRRTSMLWDFDEFELTPLEDLTDMGESEVAESASDDEIPPATPKDTDVMPHVPWPLSAVRKPQPKHRGICGVGRCMNLLVQNSRLRFCCICATRKRMIQQRHRQAGTVKLDQVDESMVYTVPPGGDLTGECPRGIEGFMAALGAGCWMLDVGC